MDSATLQIVIGGEAGQGLVTLGDILARSLVRSGYHIHLTPNYMSRIHGGHNTVAIRVGLAPVVAPQEPINILVALDAETVQLHRGEMVPGNSTVILDDDAADDVEPCVRVPFRKLAEAQYENVVALGVVAALLGLDKTVVGDEIIADFENKEVTVSAANRDAVAAAYAWAATVPAPHPTLAPAQASGTARLLMNGNEALALGAIAGGVKFCAFYPMSPATSIMQNLAKHAEEMGLIVEQAEDEIAAINMAIGGAFSGSRSMTATSGGGFALMTESVSLAGMTETPVVIVVAQRPGPATGLPTRTEQADLDLILHAGHGDFPRAIFAPGSIDACFDLMRRTFALAETSQGPVFLLTDQFLGDSYRDVAPFKLGEAAEDTPAPQEAAAEIYRPYAITASGVSPRRVPGAGLDLVVADSHEHNESGHVAEGVKQRTEMVDKRLRKSKILVVDVIAPEYEGDESPELLLMGWGSSKGAVSEAADRMRAEGARVGSLHFSQVWPLVPEQFLERLREAGEVVCVEGNATGQFARLIRRETGFEVDRLLLRYDGLPFTPEYIVEGLNHIEPGVVAQ